MFSNGPLGASLYVPDTVAIFAGFSLAVSFVLYLWAPQKYTTQASIAIFLLILGLTSTLIVQSGGLQSPFVALWFVVAVFSGAFGWWGIGIILALANSFILYSFFYNNATHSDVIVGFLSATMPVIVSYLLWSERSLGDYSQDHTVKKLNKSLEHESLKSDAIIQSIGDGVIVVEQTGKITLINPAAQRMTGWPEEDAINIHYGSVLKLENEKGKPLDNDHDPILKTLNTFQESRDSNIVILTKSGKHITTSFSVAALGSGGEGAIAVFRDITKERKEEREQAEFISTASHEMRTPVASIEGYLGLALNPATAQIDEKAREYINKAHESAQHLGHLFQDLLDVSKAEDGRLQEDPIVIDIVSFARDVLESLTPTATKKGLSVQFRPDGSKSTTGSTTISPVLYAYADKNHLREVIANLIENAIKYTPEGKVVVDTTTTGDYVRIAIEDSGLGIPSEDLSHLFQKFYRVDNSDTREIGGTGLGLYLCRRLVESMNGRIWAESEHGKGSRFYVEIPRLDHTRATRMLEDEERRKTAQNNLPPPTTPAPIATPVPTPVATVPPQTPVPMPTIPQTQRRNTPILTLERNKDDYLTRR